MTSLSDSTHVLTNVQKELPVTYPTKSAYEAGLVVDAPTMDTTDINGYPEKRTFKMVFPPVCLKTHWDPARLAQKYVLPEDLRIPLPVDPRPLTKVCTNYYTLTPASVYPKEEAEARRRLEIPTQPGGTGSLRAPYELYAKNVNAESDLWLNHPQDQCDDNKWKAESDSDLYTNRHRPPPREQTGSFAELARPLATVVPKGPYKCRAEVDERSWERSSRLFNNVTRVDRVPGAQSRATESPFSQRGARTGRVSGSPRVWPLNSVVFYVGGGDGGPVLLALAQALKARNFEVAIFAPLKTSMVEGVSYHHVTDFVPNDLYSVVVLWGTSDLLENFQYRPHARAVLMNLQYAEDKERVCLRTVKETVHKIIVKSAFHRMQYDCYPWSKFEIIPDGLPTQFYTNFENRNIARERFRVLITEYSSAVIPFVQQAWTRIKSEYPAAELHIWESPGDEKAKVRPVLEGIAFERNKAVSRDEGGNRSKGIYLHDKGDTNEMVRERLHSNIHVYLDDEPAVACEAVRMSALAGCIPVMPNVGVLKELRGINVDGAVSDEKTMIEYAKTISGIFRDPEGSNTLRRRCQQDESLKGWNSTADRWITIIKGLVGKEEFLNRIVG